MVRSVAIGIVLLILALAEAPQAYNTLRTWTGGDEWSVWWSRNAVTSPERARELAAKGLREQLISFSEGMTSIEYRPRARPETQHFDIFAIGVGQITLSDPEDTSKVEKVTVTGSRAPDPRDLPSADALPTYPLVGQFNNILLFDRRTKIMSKLFDQRLSISAFQYGWRTTPEVLIIFATDKDSNHDGKIDDNDMHDVYVYVFADHKMHKIEMPNASPKEIMDVPDADYLVVKAIVDHNKDGATSEYATYGQSQEDPATLIRIDLKTFTAAPFVAPDMLKDLQNTLDGPKPPLPQTPPR
jgi:hypothetical protein